MTRKVNRVQVNLDAGDITHLPGKEIAAILRGADDLIMSGGRSLLTKVLKGSKEKRVMEHQLNTSPVYGYYKKQPLKEIQNKVDWLILNDYLDIEYDYRLPLLVYTKKGWAIEKQTYATELLVELDQLLASGESFPDMTYLNEKSRDLVLLLLDKIEQSGHARYLPLLVHWKGNTFKKIAERIKQVIKHIEAGASPT
ncbi:MAG: superfamily II DNA helicase RecQ [Phenylobacterium sp.]|jgi:superfamily II DNA helicase RecQ